MLMDRADSIKSLAKLRPVICLVFIHHYFSLYLYQLSQGKEGENVFQLLMKF